MYRSLRSFNSNLIACSSASVSRASSSSSHTSRTSSRGIDGTALLQCEETNDVFTAVPATLTQMCWRRLTHCSCHLRDVRKMETDDQRGRVVVVWKQPCYTSVVYSSTDMLECVHGYTELVEVSPDLVWAVSATSSYCFTATCSRHSYTLMYTGTGDSAN